MNAPSGKRPETVSPKPLAASVAGLRDGSIALRDYVEAALDRVERYEGRIRSLLPEPGRKERVLAEAAALEAAWPDPASRPPLYGALLGVKDIFAADGFDTRAGSRLPPESFAMPQGPVVSALRAAGAIVLGKTVTTEFAYFAPGPTANPWDLSRTPGGSSSGSAAAVAAGFCSIAVGTQTIGSISRPAAYCGVTGWKPSYDRTSRDGVVPFSPSLDHVGLLAPLASDIAVAAALIATGWDAAAYDGALVRYARMRPILAVPDGRYLAQADASALAAFDTTVARLQGAGYSVIRVDALDDIDDINARHRRIAAAEMERTHRERTREHGRLYAPSTAELIEKGALIDDNQLELDRSGRASLRTTLERLLEEAGADYWLSPAATGPATVGLDSTGSPLMNLPWTNAGLPTLALPTCQSVDGMPMGLQLAAPFGADEALLALGAAIEATLISPR
ncbi:MAG TPA: amidase [Spirochaetales bacterium]|nr:amidase [Spirochaetales bacterium]